MNRLPARESTATDAWAQAVRAVAHQSDHGAFASLFGHFAPRVKAYLLRCGASGDQAEDLAQEAMATVWRRAASFDPQRAAVITWIYTIARNLWVDQCRRDAASRRGSWLLDLPEIDLPVESSADPVHTAQGIQHVRRALSALSPQQQEIVRLAYFDDQPQRQIAATLRIPLGTVKSRIRLAIAALRQHLQDKEL
ncbi:MAG: sigma-70 family RNA polymerase sigma factor [Steroidobacteraceae bacterium]